MTDIPGRRQDDQRVKTRWKDACKRDVDTAGLKAVEAINRATWRKKINSHTSNPQEIGTLGRRTIDHAAAKLVCFQVQKNHK